MTHPRCLLKGRSISYLLHLHDLISIASRPSLAKLPSLGRQELPSSLKTSKWSLPRQEKYALRSCILVYAIPMSTPVAARTLVWFSTIRRHCIDLVLLEGTFPVILGHEGGGIVCNSAIMSGIQAQWAPRSNPSVKE